MTRRYFAPHLPSDGGSVPIDEAEVHHALHVMRIKPGERVELFDGTGRQATATVEVVGRREVICNAQSTVVIDRENSVHIELGIAMPKGDRSKELIERLTELGVNRLVPLHCRRTQWAVSETMIPKWHRMVIEACKQCGRNRLMEITQPISFNDWTSQPSIERNASRRIAHPTGDEPFEVSRTEPSQAVSIAIGPEGGFTDDEVAASENNGWQRLNLGRRIYRIETAAIVAAIKFSGI